jgi:hypothetical protein
MTEDPLCQFAAQRTDGVQRAGIDFTKLHFGKRISDKFEITLKFWTKQV